MTLWSPRIRGIRRWLAARLGLRTAPVVPRPAERAEPPARAKALSTAAVTLTASFLQPVSVQPGVIRIATLPRSPGLVRLAGLLDGSAPQDRRA